MKNDPMPRLLTSSSSERYSVNYEDREHWTAVLNEALWPISSWIITLLNIAICSRAAWNIVFGDYHWEQHIVPIGSFILMQGMLSIIHKYYIMDTKKDVRPND